MSQHRPYEQLVYSGYEWLGVIPAHWETRRMKFGFDIQKRPIDPEMEIVTAFRDGQVTLRRNRRLDGFTEGDKQIGYQGIEPNDLVIHAMDAFAGAIGVSDSRGKSTPVYSVCLAKEGFEPRFFALVLRHLALTGFIESLAKGIRERSTDFRWSDAKNIVVPVPALKEQQEILNFLDRETAELDAFISDQEELVVLLRERRSATITHVVTKGLTPDVQLRESSVEWLGKVPAAWTVKPLKHLTRFTAGGTPDSNNPDFWSDEVGTPWVSISDMSSRDTVATSMKLVTDAGLRDKNLRVMGAGTVLFAMYASVGEVAILEMEAASNQAILGLTPKSDQADPKFLFYALKAINKWLPSLYRSSTQNNLNAEQVGNFRIPTPSLDEQREISAYLDDETAEIDAAIADAREAMELSKERRAALISAAVTGKIDVRSHITAELGAA